jgi:guanidinobutyrase
MDLPISKQETCKAKARNQPLSGNEMPRAGGIATMMRLSSVDSTDDLDVAFIGIPFDTGASNRVGTRFGPRQIRSESIMIRPYGMGTGAAPFDSLAVADRGDVPINPYSIEKSMTIIERFYDEALANRCRTLSLGGDHTIVLPILRSMAKTHGPVGLVHVDAHADCNDTMFGESIAHGTPVRRALEEGLIDPHAVVQIGLRGTGYTKDDYEWGRQQGFRVIQAEQCWHKSLVPLMAEVRAMLEDRPVYISFDIDSLDPSVAPGTGTPEPGGLTAIQGLEIVRGCRGLNIVGGDLVEVCPPYDPSGNTAMLAANILFEMLSVLPGVTYR